jgi:hypothetical protein
MQEYQHPQATGVNALHAREVENNGSLVQFAKNRVPQSGKAVASYNPPVTVEDYRLPGSFYPYVQHSELLDSIYHPVRE